MRKYFNTQAEALAESKRVGAIIHEANQAYLDSLGKVRWTSPCYGMSLRKKMAIGQLNTILL